MNFAKHPLLEPDAPPANTDPRLLFYSSDWSGFDVVIGNPPYGKVDPGKRKNLKQNKRFKTTEGNDLYNLIAEASLTLAKPAGGIITLIVPLSICFGQDQKQTRSLFESRCDRVTLRNQDIRPDKTFHDSPVEHPQNSQRTTIIVARTGESKCIIEVSGINKWRKSERHEYLTSRAIPLTRQGGPAVDPKVDTQWERVSTPEIQELIKLHENCRHENTRPQTIGGESAFHRIPSIGKVLHHCDPCRYAKQTRDHLSDSKRSKPRTSLGSDQQPCRICLVESIRGRFSRQPIRDGYYSDSNSLAGRSAN